MECSNESGIISKQLPQLHYTYQSQIVNNHNRTKDGIDQNDDIESDREMGHDVPTKQHQELDYEIESVELLHKVTTDDEHLTFNEV